MEDRADHVDGTSAQEGVVAGGQAGAGSDMVSIIIRAGGQVRAVRALIKRIADVMSAVDGPHEIIVVYERGDEAIAEVGDDAYAVRLMRVDSRGPLSAFVEGFRQARGATLVCMAADLEHPPEVIPEMLGRLGDPSVELVLAGNVARRAWRPLEWVAGLAAVFLAGPLRGVKDPFSDLLAIRRDVLDRAEALSPTGSRLALELIVRCSCKEIRQVAIPQSSQSRRAANFTVSELIRFVRQFKRLADVRYGGFSRLVQFCLVGATGMVVDLSMLAVLLALHLSFGPARALAILAAMTWNYSFNRRVTFSYSRSGSILSQYPRFVASCSVGSFISWAVSVGLVDSTAFFAFLKFVAAFIGIVLGTFSNFTLSRWWVFRQLSAPAGGQDEV